MNVGDRWFKSIIVNATMFVMCSCFITFMIVSVMSFLSSKSISFYDSGSEKDTITLIDTIYVQNTDTVIIVTDTVIRNVETSDNDGGGSIDD